MKATINGITVEGTPEEIAQYSKLISQHQLEGLTNPNTNPPFYQTTLMKVGNVTGALVKENHCPNYPNACYCTGECMK